MEFRIRMMGAAPDIDTIEDALRVIDPAALADVDGSGLLRVAAMMDAAQLAASLSQAGYPVAAHQVTQLPSICCGGCSG
ncbi:MAG: hypothetical protein ACOH1R_09130 [Luteimonas sp.]